MKLKYFITILIITITSIYGAYILKKRNERNHIHSTMNCSADNFNNYTGTIKIIKKNNLPYINGKRKFEKTDHYDNNGIPLHNYKGNLNYHPVFLVQRALYLLDIYNTTKENKYLTRAQKISKKLIDISISINNSIFIPYSFNFSLHGNQKDTMIAPWYSGMAQGQILSLLVRLYEITNDDFYLKNSQKLFNSFKLSYHNRTKKPWISCVDENKYLWLEEYPNNPPAYTLNGMIFAIFGIYDFYRITKSLEVEKILRGSIQTIKDNIHKFREPNGISHYCLRHPNVQSLSYHNIHIEQLGYLYKITDDEFFLEMSNNFINDTKDIDKKK